MSILTFGGTPLKFGGSSISIASAQSRSSKLLSYMNSLNTNTGGSSNKILSGQYTIYTGDSAYTGVATATGQAPAMYCTTFDFSSTDGRSAASDTAISLDEMETLTARQYAANSLILVTLDSGIPITNTGPCVDLGNPPNSMNVTSAQFTSICTPGNTLNNYFMAACELYAQEIVAITSSGGNVVLFKPFIEMNGSWNWYGAQNATQFIALWQQMYNYIMSYPGVAGHVLWVFNANAGYPDTIQTYYPGAAYVDIISIDIYDYPQSQMAADVMVNGFYTWAVAQQKPFIVGELGMELNGTPFPVAANTIDNTIIISLIQEDLPAICGFCMWDQGNQIANQNNATALMTNAAIVNVSGLPAGIN